MQQIPTAITQANSPVNPHGNPRERGLPTSIEKTLNARNKAQLAEILSQLCALQKQYGKTQAELETLVEGFSWALADYAMPEIIKAMRKYVLTASDIPAPADVIKIIEGARKPSVLEVSIDTLLTYHRKGIPLTRKQVNRLHEAGHAEIKYTGTEPP